MTDLKTPDLRPILPDLRPKSPNFSSGALRQAPRLFPEQFANRGTRAVASL